jgi:DNA-binding NtrC family response regulator
MGQLDPDFCKGLRVLLVEDESIIAMLTEQMLREMGCDDIHIVGTVPTALSVIDRDPPDLAVLDVNLRGEMVLPVAQKLARAGIPFAFATGYGKTEMLNEFHHYPILQKPFDMPDLENALRSLLAGPPPGLRTA